jgi:hypothetical protein
MIGVNGPVRAPTSTPRIDARNAAPEDGLWVWTMVWFSSMVIRKR